MKGTDLAMCPKEQPALYFVGNPPAGDLCVAAREFLDLTLVWNPTLAHRTRKDGATPSSVVPTETERRFQ
jgi:hypothetical protein